MSKMNTVRIANNEHDLKAIFTIRRTVFVEEQKVDESEEYDEYETSSTHLIAFVGNEPAGTCRFRNTDKGVKLERFAVLQKFRGMDVGESLVSKTLELVDLSQHVYLHAQIQVVDFYARYGFKKIGPEFVEANIRHYKMVYDPS